MIMIKGQSGMLQYHKEAPQTLINNRNKFELLKLKIKFLVSLLCILTWIDIIYEMW